MSQLKGSSCEGETEEVGLSSSSLSSQAFLLLFLQSSCWAFHLSLLPTLLSLPFLHLCVPLPYTHPSHTFWATSYCCSLFVLSFFFEPHVVNSAKNYKVSDIEKLLVTIKKNKECYIYLCQTEPFSRF